MAPGIAPSFHRAFTCGTRLAESGIHEARPRPYRALCDRLLDRDLRSAGRCVDVRLPGRHVLESFVRRTRFLAELSVRPPPPHCARRRAEPLRVGAREDRDARARRGAPGVLLARAE